LQCAQDFVAYLNKNGQRWVPILDPPIHIKPGYAAYDTGIAQDVFIKDITGNNYVGQVCTPKARLSISAYLYRAHDKLTQLLKQKCAFDMMKEVVNSVI